MALIAGLAAPVVAPTAAHARPTGPLDNLETSLREWARQLQERLRQPRPIPRPTPPPTQAPPAPTTTPTTPTTAPPPTQPPTPPQEPSGGLSAWPAGRPGSFRIAYGDPEAALAESRSDRSRRIYLLNPDRHDIAGQIKQANPEALVLAYKDLASARSNEYAYDAATGQDKPFLPTGVGYGYANQHHPEWFLTDASGNRMEWDPYPGSWQMDIGNPEYQRTWAENVRSELPTYGWDGVFMDNAATNATVYGPAATKYPSNEAMTAATRSMLAAVSPPLQQAGLLAVANIGGSRAYPGLWADWISLLDGAMEEFFTVSDQGRAWDWGPDGWREHLEQVASSARLGKMALLRVGGSAGNAEEFRYGLATYLLANDGRSVVAPPEFDAPTRFPEFDLDLGAPRGPAQELPGSVWLRRFERGTVLVNASQGPATAAVDSQSITLPATSGTIITTR